jgi:hypothetical protein
VSVADVATFEQEYNLFCDVRGMIGDARLMFGGDSMM